MELGFIDLGAVSAYISREQNSVWGVGRAADGFEVWAGRSYACVSINKRKMDRVVGIAAAALFAFTVGWFMDPPISVAHDIPPFDARMLVEVCPPM